MATSKANVQSAERGTSFERATAPTEPIDALLATEGLYAVAPRVVTELRIAHLRAAVAHHREHNAYFDRHCLLQGFDHERICTHADLDRIPLLPVGVFKRHPDLAWTPTHGPAVDTTSSGTQGLISRVRRDDATLMRFFATIAIGNREVLGVETFDRQILNLGPPTHEAPHLWISYVMAGVAVLFTTRCYVHDDRLEVDRLVADLQSVAPGDAVTVVGPPPLLLDLVDVLQRAPRVALGPEALVLTVGGWKRRIGDAVPRSEFDSRVASALGLQGPDRVRDTFNMVELNSVLFECAYKAKHCPPWLLVRARDTRTLKSLGSGEPGILAFLDPTPKSYPGFILSDDLGVVHHALTCPCGITGDTVIVERRVKRVDARGCALKLETVDVNPPERRRTDG